MEQEHTIIIPISYLAMMHFVYYENTELCEILLNKIIGNILILQHTAEKVTKSKTIFTENFTTNNL